MGLGFRVTMLLSGDACLDRHGAVSKPIEMFEGTDAELKDQLQRPGDLRWER